jgi:CRISPR/Cas system-associated protein Csx1
MKTERDVKIPLRDRKTARAFVAFGVRLHRQAILKNKNRQNYICHLENDVSESVESCLGREYAQRRVAQAILAIGRHDG